MPRMPQVTARELVHFLKSQGFVEDRQSGAHLTLWHEMRKVSVTVPIHTAPISGAASPFAFSKTLVSPLTTTFA